MTPAEKLVAIKKALCPDTEQGSPDLHNYPLVMLDKAITHIHDETCKTPSLNPTINDLLHKVMARVNQAMEILNEPDARLADRFPDVINHEEHQQE